MLPGRIQPPGHAEKVLEAMECQQGQIAMMMKTRLQQPRLQTHPSCGTAKGDTEGDTGSWQERRSGGGQRCRQLLDAPDLETVKQERWMGPMGGKARGSCQWESRGLSGDTLGPLLNDSSLALVAEPTAPPECPGSAPELPPAAARPMADTSQEWKVAKIHRVLINPVSEPRKVGLSCSTSLSEKELKEAKARSRRIAAQLTTAPSPTSRGVQLFNRRKQRVDGLTGTWHGGGLPLSPTPQPRQTAMEEGKEQGMKLEPDQPGTQGEGLRANASPCQEPPAEDQQVPLSIYLKENMALATTNGMQEQVASGLESGVGGLRDAGAPVGLSVAALAPTQSPKEGKNGEMPGEVPSTPVGTATGMASLASQHQNGMQGRQYYEVHLTLAKPKPVKNRTARPFGTQASPASSGQPVEGPLAPEMPPPPTYAETLNSPPPLTRVLSPPAYSALYPHREQKMLPCPALSCGVSRPNPLPKTGILEESAARRAGKKSMFTFVEKAKLGPNPDLLDLVQSVDSRKKQKEQGEPSAEDESFALGAEAANFVPNSTARGGQHLLPTNDAPAWSSCLKSPTIQPKPKPQPSHNLSEARGKGAELFARRQSRMEKFIIEAPSQPELLRSPSPTMSLPPSWKYDVNACLSPMVSRHNSKSTRLSKTSPAPLYSSNLMENEVSQKELEISKHQPYQLQSSLFILSPSKGPVRSMPQEVPPSRPSLPDAYTYPQQTSCPTSPLPPSPVWHPPAMPSTRQTTSSPFASTTGALPLTHSSHANPEAPAEVLLASPCRLLPPRAKGGFQAPRPSYSTRNAGIEAQERRPSLPASPTWTPRLARRPGSLDGWASPASVPELDEGPPTSPPWSERSLSPLRQDPDPRASRQIQARLARNIINAARRKSSSPRTLGPEGSRPFTPISAGPPSLPQSPRPARLEGSRAPGLQAASSMLGSLGRTSPTHKSSLPLPREDGTQFGASPGMSRATWAEGRRLLLPPSVSSCPVPRLSPSPKSPLPSPVVGGRSPAKRCTSRSPTDSDVSLDSEDSGTKIPGIHSFNLCPRGWMSSLRLKPGRLPSGAPCTS